MRADAPALAMTRTTLKNIVTSKKKKKTFTFTATAEVRSTLKILIFKYCEFDLMNALEV